MPDSLVDSLDNESAVKVSTRHAVFGEDREGHLEWDALERESAGTQRLIALAGPLIQTLREGIVLVVDEDYKGNYLLGRYGAIPLLSGLDGLDISGPTE